MVEPYTHKIKGTIIGLLMLASINSSASHNFLLEDIANKLGIDMVRENSFWVRLGDGQRR